MQARGRPLTRLCPTSGLLRSANITTSNYNTLQLRCDTPCSHFSVNSVQAASFLSFHPVTTYSSLRRFHKSSILRKEEEEEDDDLPVGSSINSWIEKKRKKNTKEAKTQDRDRQDKKEREPALRAK